MSISRYLGICLGNLDKLSYRPTYYRSTGFSSEHTNTNIEKKSDDVTLHVISAKMALWNLAIRRSERVQVLEERTR